MASDEIQAAFNYVVENTFSNIAEGSTDMRIDYVKAIGHLKLLAKALGATFTVPSYIMDEVLMCTYCWHPHSTTTKIGDRPHREFVCDWCRTERECPGWGT